MKIGVARFAGTLVVCLGMIVGIGTTALAGIPEGFRDIKLGMNKIQVLDQLKKNKPIHFSYDDMGGEIGEIIRGDKLFRYATYRFDKQGVLIEIGLEMREIIGREKVLDMFNQEHGLKVSPHGSTIESDRAIEVRENGLIMKIAPNVQHRSAKGNP